MSITEIAGSRLALLLMGESEDGEDDWAVITGIAKLKDGELVLDRGPDNADFEVRSEWIVRIKPTRDEVRSILGDCDFFLPLSVGQASDDELKEMDPTGISWPEYEPSNDR